MIVASFDLGIKNLSYCVARFDASGSFVEIQRWANLNLLADGADSQTQTRCAVRSACKGGPASLQDVFGPSGIQILCKKCAKKAAKPVLDMKGAKVAEWRAWAATPAGLGITEGEAKRMTKTAIEERAAAKFLIPYKAPKAKGVSLQSLLAGMEVCLTAELGWLAAADRIRLENQPAEFAPHMKSIQIMLFTLLDHRLRVEKGWKGTMEFASAGVKTRGLGAGTGKDAKRDRKLAGIQRVTDVLTKGSQTQKEWLAWWKSQAKLDDLADAFLMCLDGAT
jgi:hypothetical protein